MQIPESFGIEKRERLADPYLVAGDRAYLVGTQDGAFPDLGWHVEGEMGGVWTPPIKLFDGFWLQIDGVWLDHAGQFEAGPFWALHRYAPAGGLEVTRRQFVPDGEPAVVVRFRFLSPLSRELCVRFLARSDLQPVWSPQPAAAVRLPDTAVYRPEIGAWVCTSGEEGWVAVVGAAGRQAEHQDAGRDVWGPERTRGEGVSVTLEYRLTVAAGHPSSLDFVLCGSTEGTEAAIATFRRVSGALELLWEAKGTRFERLKGASVLDVPDPSIARAWDWLKFNNDWLVCEVPGIGRGLCAGAPDYMWWFGCDSAYSVLGCLALGQPETAVATLDLVRERSIEGNGDCGRVMHECTTIGAVVHPGCAQETPHFTEAVWAVYLWTGDLDFLARNYEFCRRGLLDWTIGERSREGEVLPYGYGITEIEGLNLQCIDTAVHTACALSALGEMADVLEDGPTASRCRRLAAEAREQIERAFWLDDEGLYADMLATPEELMPRIRRWITAIEAHELAQGRQPEVLEGLNALLRRVESDPNQQRRGWLLSNWVVIAPLEAGLAPEERARRVLLRVNGPEFTGPSGMYLSGRDHTHAMSVNTGALAAANLHYGVTDEALAHLRTMTDTLPLHMPGAVSEMLPDYGCCVQAWSAYAIAWPIVSGVFGVRPDAARRVLRLEPAFPATWPAARLQNLRIGGTACDLIWDGGILRVFLDEPGWRVETSNPGVRLEVAHGRAPAP